MVDRAARDRLTTAIEEFLAEEIGAFEFDDRISAIAHETKDETVDEVAARLWYFYDDNKDHTANLSREAWDYFQRLLLLLRSDATLSRNRNGRWTWRQPVALAALVAFAVGVFLLGVGWQLLVITIPLGVVSITLKWCRARETSTDDYDAESPLLTPYESVSDLLTVHRTVPGFRKQRYTKRMEEAPPLRHLGAIALAYVNWFAMWLVFSPVALVFQALPEIEESGTAQVVPA